MQVASVPAREGIVNSHRKLRECVRWRSGKDPARPRPAEFAMARHEIDPDREPGARHAILTLPGTESAQSRHKRQDVLGIIRCVSALFRVPGSRPSRLASLRAIARIEIDRTNQAFFP